MSFAEEQESISEHNSPSNSRVPSEDNPFDDNAKENKTKDADNFLVCVFNVSSKVSYSILQVAKTSTAQNVICQALNKSRKDSGGERRVPEHFVLVEETDCPDHSRKANKSNKQRRILDPSENVYLVQLSWKGAGRLILEEKDKVSNE